MSTGSSEKRPHKGSLKNAGQCYAPDCWCNRVALTSNERLGVIKQTPRQASIDDIEWLCEEVERLRGEAEVADEQLAQLRGFAEAHKTCRGSDETSERQPAVAVLREVLENISTVSPLEHFPAVTALAYCREKAIEALNATSAFQEVIVGEYEADGKVNMASSPLPEGTKLYARLPLRHSEKAVEQPQCSGLCQGHSSEASLSGWLPDANCPVHGLKATLSEGSVDG